MDMKKLIKKDIRCQTRIISSAKIPECICGMFFLSKLNIHIAHLSTENEANTYITNYETKNNGKNALPEKIFTIWSAKLSQIFRLSSSPYLLSSSNKSS